MLLLLLSSIFALLNDNNSLKVMPILLTEEEEKILNSIISKPHEGEEKLDLRMEIPKSRQVIFELSEMIYFFAQSESALKGFEDLKLKNQNDKDEDSTEVDKPLFALFPDLELYFNELSLLSELCFAVDFIGLQCGIERMIDLTSAYFLRKEEIKMAIKEINDLKNSKPEIE